jgi:hypothetical protein
MTWFLDSDASTHVTSDINSLSYACSYNVSDQMHIGNDTGLSILHIATITLLIETIPIKLNNVLHVPQMSKNLLSVSQLTKDNVVTV